jgi:hypothetical protein
MARDSQTSDKVPKPVLHPPLDAGDFLSGDVLKVGYEEPLDLGPELGKAKTDPTKPGIFDAD